MALFAKQDFTPPLLSRKWIAIKCRPNMLVHSRAFIVAVLESGLMFREDSLAVEQLMPSAEAEALRSALGYSGWLTRGERWLSGAGVVVFLAVFAVKMPPTNGSGAAVRAGACACVPAGVRALHRSLAPRGALPALLGAARDYTALCRRAMACLKEYKLISRGLGSVSAVAESLGAALCRQQADLALAASRGSSALLANLPWLHEDVSWDAVAQLRTEGPTPNVDADLVKIHNAFLVIQSTLLKHIAMAHFQQNAKSQSTYGNHNERVYWLHTELIPSLTAEFSENHDALDRLYRLLRNCSISELATSKTIKPSGLQFGRDSWLYSDIHTGIAIANMELKVAFTKCNSLDTFLDTCCSNKQEVDLDVLSSDIEALTDHLRKCLASVHVSQIKLKKMQNKNCPMAIEETGRVEELEYDTKVVKIDDCDPEAKDEVYFFIKTDIDDNISNGNPNITTDSMTEPGKKERDARNIVLNELKVKLVTREDQMREREAKALEKTMPELKGNIPEFPRQLQPKIQIPTAKTVDINSIKKEKRKWNSIVKRTLSRLELKKVDFKSKRRNLRKLQKKLFDRISTNPSLIQSTLCCSMLKWLPVDKKGYHYAQITFDKTTVMFMRKYDLDSYSSVKVKGSRNKLAINKILQPQCKSYIETTVDCLSKFSDYSKNNTSAFIKEIESESETNYNSDSLSLNVDSEIDPNIHLSDSGKLGSSKGNKVEVDSDGTNSSDTDFDAVSSQKSNNANMLNDVRKYRVARKKNFPTSQRKSLTSGSLDSTSNNSTNGYRVDVSAVSSKKSAADELEDEGLKPIEYSFGTGMALASMFRAENADKFASRIGQEEVFVGDGEVSSDSGNDEDA